MQGVVPPVYSRQYAVLRASVSARLFALAISLSCGAVLLTAASLPPAHRGYGTHTALGLAPCSFLAHTGFPCPACGMTTSFACFVRGRIGTSLWVQPMGTVLAVLTGCAFWGGLYIAVTGRPVYQLLELIPGRYYVLPLISWALVAWAWKIFIHVGGLERF